MGRNEQVIRKRMFALLLALGAICLSQQVHACSIPVFRYALDRWSSDAYRLEVTDADAQDPAVAKFMRNLGASAPYNLEGTRLPADKAGTSKLLFPVGKDGQRVELWHGNVNSEMLNKLIESSVRGRVLASIMEGASVVWVFVESGNQAADDAAVAKLEKRLHYLENVAQLPVIDPTDPTSKLGPGPKLQVKFTVIRVNKSDASEELFLKMLAGSKADENLTKGSWLAAVFGRGRVLGSWPADGFGDEQVEEVCMFLMGACSCQVKNLNPGWDLLLSADWEAELIKADKHALTAVDSKPPIVQEKAPEPETVKIEGTPVKVPEGASLTSPTVIEKAEQQVGNAKEVNWPLIGGAGVLLVAAVCFWFGVQTTKR